MTEPLRIVDRIDAAERIGAARAAESNLSLGRTSDPLPLEWFEDITPVLSGQWLIKQLIPATGIVVMYGHPGSGKTFLALDIAFHVALGADWFDKRVTQGCVIYVGAEGLAGLRNRITAFRKDRGGDRAAFALIPTPIDLQAPDADVKRLAEAIRAVSARYGCKPALIVVDTLSKTFGGGKENGDDMASYVANCGRIAAEFECCVMPVHHRPKDAESEEPRGHSSLKGGADTVILVEGGATKKMRVTKQKDAEIGATILFNLRTVSLGQDEDGDEVTSCVVDQANVDLTPAGDPLAQIVAKLPAGSKLALRQLDEVTIAHGIVPPAEIPDSEIDRMRVGKVVAIGIWREKAISAAGTEAGQERDTVKKAFNRGLKSLQSKGIVRVYEGFAWRERSSTGTTGTQPGQRAGQDRDTGTDGTHPFRGVPMSCPASPDVEQENWDNYEPDSPHDVEDYNG